MLAANLDLAVIVLSARNPDWKAATLDRYLVLVSQGGITPHVVLNKIDLDTALPEDAILATYPRMGVSITYTSIISQGGLAELERIIAGKTCVFLGPSGAGKSSLINALAPGRNLRVGEVSERTRKGQHTTTWVEMIPLGSGSRLVDSPGIRVLDLTGMQPDRLQDHFPEIANRTRDCRFQDCLHRSEPDCGVKAAVEEGAMAPHRYDSYLRIFESLARGEG